MPVAKLLDTSTPDAMKVDEGTDSLDTFIRQAVGKEPLFSLSRTGDSPGQWIQFLHQLDQQDLPGWPLLAPMKVQMQKCDKCAREFSSPINYRRHTRVHRRSLNFHKDPQKYRALLGAFWDKLSYDEAKEIMSFKDVNLEEVPGSSIVRNISANMRKPVFLSFPQAYVRAGSALVDIIKGRPSRLPITSRELFSILDDASERTFLCAGTAESLQKYVFDGEAGKIGLEMKNLIACTSFLVEQKLVKACLADKDAEALRCQKLLVEEEEAAQKRQAAMLERKRQRKLRQKEQKVREQMKAADEYAASADASSPQSSASAEVDSYIPDENFPMPLDPIKLLNNDNDVDIEAQVGSTSDHSDSTISRNTEHLKIHKNGLKHFKPRWQLPNLQKGRRNNFHGDHNLKREQRAAVVNGSKVWAKKFKPEYGGGGLVKERVQNDAVNHINQINCQLMIGSISVTVRNCQSQNKVDSLVEIHENSTTDTTYQLAESRSMELLESDTTSANEADQNLPTVSYHHSCELRHDSKGTNGIYSHMENEVKQEGPSFSVHAAKAFLAQRWKEAASGEHVKLVLSSSELPRQPEYQEHIIFVSAENRLENTRGNVKPQFRTKPEKGMKTKYIPKQRPSN